MIEQVLEPTSLESTPVEKVERNPARCFVVPVASVEADYSEVLHRIWELASQSGTEVRFVGLSAEKAREGELRRSLVTMAAVLRSGGVAASVDILTGRDWANRLRSSLGPEDTVICQVGPSEGFLHRSLGRQLQVELDAPFYILSGPAVPQASQPHWLVQAAAWTGSAAILAAFFLLQVKIGLLGSGLAVFLGSLSVIAEVVLICAWNAWLSGDHT